jgi:hypothetical protein
MGAREIGEKCNYNSVNTDFRGERPDNNRMNLWGNYNKKAVVVPLGSIRDDPAVIRVIRVNAIAVSSI